MADGKLHLLYELHFTNYAPLAIELRGIEVLGNGTDGLASFKGSQLEDMVIPVERLSSGASPSEYKGSVAIGEGRAVVVFMDLTLSPGMSAPAELHHRFSIFVARKTSPNIETTINGPEVTVVQEPILVLTAPLRGSGWVAINALGAKDHRRGPNAVDGRERIPQRFAIDWVLLGPDGRLFHGDGKSNTDYYDYGSEVLAVADGRIADTRDGEPEYTGSSERSARNVTIDNAFGNCVVLEIGAGRYAVYAHLQPGSLRVKPGDKVKAGQVLALLGNSGNSDGPHLHFQVVDRPAPMASEGIPYEFETFTQLGFVPDDPTVQDNGSVLLKESDERPVVRKREFPMNNAAVKFPWEEELRKRRSKEVHRRPASEGGPATPRSYFLLGS
jgi:murein DD-endopeptidase MepM/ murein hydrolase activator NlpD